MAKKRAVEVEVPPSVETEEELPDIPEKFIDKGWKEWLITDYMRYWYLLGCMLVDAFVGLQLASIVPSDVSQAAFVIFLAFAIVGEYFLYRRLWPKER